MASAANDIASSPFPSSDTRPVTQITVTPDRTVKDFFGEDGLTFRDALDAINPLNHIPFVSGLLADATGHKPSVGSQLIGGALLGGPVGFVASLVNVIFEQETGKGVGESMVAGLMGDDTKAATQVAAAQIPQEQNAAELADNTSKAAPVDAVSTTSQKLAQADLTGNATALVQRAQAGMMPSGGSDNANDKSRARDRALLDLYGGSAPSAHRSYQNAQLRPYLNDVTTSQVL